MRHHQLINYTWVTHGMQSGGLFARHFSNKTDSHQSSLGVFLTGYRYHGHYGDSLTLTGLEKGVNDHARKRNIVLHGSPLVNQHYIDRHGRLPRSWGCLAVNQQDVHTLIEQLQGGSLLFVYAKAEQQDPYLKSCSLSS